MEKLTEFSLLAPARCVAEDVFSLLVVVVAVEVVDDAVEVCSINDDSSSETELHLVS